MDTKKTPTQLDNLSKLTNTQTSDTPPATSSRLVGGNTTSAREDRLDVPPIK